jgi:diketogulonate reductase-like aldo/keto reductase
LTSDLLDYIDLFLIHGPLMGPEKRVDTWRNLVDFMHRSEGKIRAVGVSNFGIAHLEALREAGLEVPSVNQIEVSSRTIIEDT